MREAASAFTSASWHLLKCPGAGGWWQKSWFPTVVGLKVLEGGAPGQNSGMTASHLLKTPHLTTQDLAKIGPS